MPGKTTIDFGIEKIELKLVKRHRQDVLCWTGEEKMGGEPSETLWARNHVIKVSKNH